MDIKEYKKLAKLIRDNEIYKVYDLPLLRNLTVSLTELNPRKSTTGHSHLEADEVYIFIKGRGVMKVDGKMLAIKSGDIILVPAGDFHKVYNKTPTPRGDRGPDQSVGSEKKLSFWTIFEKYKGRGK
jgi:mannose-6-phosphate isomerase-like protein (cupin superfamily)